DEVEMKHAPQRHVLLDHPDRSKLGRRRGDRLGIGDRPRGTASIAVLSEGARPREELPRTVIVDAVAPGCRRRRAHAAGAEKSHRHDNPSHAGPPPRPCQNRTRTPSEGVPSAAVAGAGAGAGAGRGLGRLEKTRTRLAPSVTTAAAPVMGTA